MTRTRALVLALIAALAVSAGFVTAAVSVAGATTVKPFALTPEEIEIRELAKAKEAERIQKAREAVAAKRLVFNEHEREILLAARAKAKEKRLAEKEEYKALLEAALGTPQQAQVEAEVKEKEEKAKEVATALVEKEKERAVIRKERFNGLMKLFLEKAKQKAKEQRPLDEQKLREIKEKERQRQIEKEEREKHIQELIEQKEKEKEV